jgi:hypothetical protein
VIVDIKQRLKRIKFFEVEPDLSALSRDEYDALSLCIGAAEICSELYLDQVREGNRELYRQLFLRGILGDEEGRDLASYFAFHGRPWDRFDHQPFVPGFGPRPSPYLGSYYPMDLTKAEWEGYLATHSERREQLESCYTVIQRLGHELQAVPYSLAYRSDLKPISARLQNAAGYLPGTPLGTFLSERAEAFATNEYLPSELAWVDTDGMPFEVTIGPYEQYMDELAGIKASFMAYIGLPDMEMTAAVEKFLPFLHDMNAELADRLGFQPAGGVSRVIVTNDVFRGGEAAHGGFQFTAYCLPNDRRVHEMKGSKRVISRTTLTEKFTSISRPIAERVLRPEDVGCFSVRSRLLWVTAHELAHGLGPTMIERSDGIRVPFEVALGAVHSPLEEAKADVLGAVLSHRFAQQGIVSADDLAGCYVGEIVDFVRQLRVGPEEAHAKGAMLQYNWLRQVDAVRYDGTAFSVSVDRMAHGLEMLADVLIQLEQAGDPVRANAFMDEWSRPPVEFIDMGQQFKDLPIDVCPQFQLPW